MYSPPELARRIKLARGVLLLASLLALAGQSCRHGGALYEQVNAKVSLVGAAGDDIVVRVTIANQGTSVTILATSDLPVDGKISHFLFDVERNGQPLEHLVSVDSGTVANKFIAIEPGHQRSAVIALAQAFDVASHGEYKITYHSSVRRENWLGMPTDNYYLYSNVLVVNK